MNYLVSNNVFTLNNGPEFTSFERLHAFNSHGIPTKLLLKNYNNDLTTNLASHKINRKNVINMYDFFQGIVDEPNKPVNVHYLPSFPFDTYHLKGIDNNQAQFDYYGNRKGTIDFAPGQVTKVGSIDYFDRLGHKACTEHWDSRGFPSRLDSYHLNGTVGTSRYLRRDGSTAILVTHMNVQGRVVPTMWKLFDYRGRNWLFDSEDDLFKFFLNEINRQHRGNFITERRGMDRYVFAINNPLLRIAVVHSVPVKNAKRPEKSPLQPLANTLFDPHHQYPVHFDRIVFATEEERQVFADRFQSNVPDTQFVTAADAYVDVTSDRHEAKGAPVLVYQGLLGKAKNTEAIINAFRFVHKQSKTTSLKLRGYFVDNKEEKSLKDLVKRLNLTADVIFEDYHAFDPAFFDDATIFINATNGEAFGMNALEAMAEGVPVVTYDVPYIAGNLVEGGKNGLLVKKRNPHSLADAVLALLNDYDQYQQLSQGAFATAEQFDEDRLVGDWRKVLGLNDQN